MPLHDAPVLRCLLCFEAHSTSFKRNPTRFASNFHRDQC
jgi:hypothetical protein